MTGQVLNGRYEIKQRLGGGGMAVVYKATDSYLGRPVSIKVLREQLATDPALLQRFRREAKAVASLSHPNVVSLFDVGQEVETNYLVMEYVEGETLKKRISERGALSPAATVGIAVQILDALEHAHGKKVIHRDIKPHNILITPSGLVKVTDFGIARAVDGSTLVHTGEIVGSAHYFSPEQAKGQPVDACSDLYSLGVVIFEMLTGRLPFEGDNPLTIALKHIQEEAPDARLINGLVPSGLERIVRRALAKEPSQRYQSAAEFRADLEAWREGKAGDRPEPATHDTLVIRGNHEWARRVNGAGAGGRGAGGRGARGRGARGAGEGDTGRGKGRRAMFLVVLSFLLALLGISGYGAYAFYSWIQVPSVEVPEVEGLTLMEAQRLLDKEGLYVDVVAERHSSRIPANYVLEQKKAPGEMVKRGSAVSLVVSRGPEWLSVPDVRRMHRLEARNQLENADLEVDEVLVYDEVVPEGYVLDQKPRQGEQVQRGARVYLTVSKGVVPEPFKMPDLVGGTLDKVRLTIEEAGLRLGVVSQAATPFAAGVVAAQNPKPGVSVVEGNAVDITVSTGCAAVAGRTILVTAEDTVTVRVTLADRWRERVVYEGIHPPGSEVEVRDICWDGEAARLTVYFNETMVSSEVWGR